MPASAKRELYGYSVEHSGVTSVCATYSHRSSRQAACAQDRSGAHCEQAVRVLCFALSLYAGATE